MPDDDSHSYGIVAGQTEDGESVTIFDAPGEQAHHWREGTAPEGTRVVGDEHGNMVAWNSETGEVTTAMREQDDDPDVSSYQVSKSELEF